MERNETDFWTLKGLLYAKCDIFQQFKNFNKFNLKKFQKFENKII